MSRNWQIVLGSPANRREILQIFRAYRAELGATCSKDHEAAVSRLLVDASAGRIYMIEVAGEAAGFACICFQQSVLWAGRLAVLESICVLRKFQGMGLSPRILRAIIGDLENFGPSVVTAYLREDDPLTELFEREEFKASRLVRFTDQSPSGGV